MKKVYAQKKKAKLASVIDVTGNEGDLMNIENERIMFNFPHFIVIIIITLNV